MSRFIYLFVFVLIAIVRTFSQEITPDNLPRSVSLKEYCPEVLNQLDYNPNSCGGYAFGYYSMSLILNKAFGLTTQESKDGQHISASYLFEHSGSNMHEGRDIDSILTLLSTKGNLINRRDIKSTAMVKISSFEKIYKRKDLILGESQKVKYRIKEILSSGLPLQISIMVGNQFLFEMNGKKLYDPKGITPERHYVTIIGYNDDSERFLLINSYGQSWGDKGYFEINQDKLIEIAENIQYFKIDNIEKFKSVYIAEKEITKCLINGEIELNKIFDVSPDNISNDLLTFGHTTNNEDKICYITQHPATNDVHFVILNESTNVKISFPSEQIIVDAIGEKLNNGNILFLITSKNEELDRFALYYIVISPLHHIIVKPTLLEGDISKQQPAISNPFWFNGNLYLAYQSLFTNIVNFDSKSNIFNNLGTLTIDDLAKVQSAYITQPLIKYFKVFDLYIQQLNEKNCIIIGTSSNASAFYSCSFIIQLKKNRLQFEPTSFDLLFKANNKSKLNNNSVKFDNTKYNRIAYYENLDDFNTLIIGTSDKYKLFIYVLTGKLDDPEILSIDYLLHPSGKEIQQVYDFIIVEHVHKLPGGKYLIFCTLGFQGESNTACMMLDIKTKKIIEIKSGFKKKLEKNLDNHKRIIKVIENKSNFYFIVVSSELNQRINKTKNELFNIPYKKEVRDIFKTYVIRMEKNEPFTSSYKHQFKDIVMQFPNKNFKLGTGTNIVVPYILKNIKKEHALCNGNIKVMSNLQTPFMSYQNFLPLPSLEKPISDTLYLHFKSPPGEYQSVSEEYKVFLFNGLDMIDTTSLTFSIVQEKINIEVALLLRDLSTGKIVSEALPNKKYTLELVLNNSSNVDLNNLSLELPDYDAYFSFISGNDRLDSGPNTIKPMSSSESKRVFKYNIYVDSEFNELKIKLYHDDKLISGKAIKLSN